jgi:hypothetical protein
MLRTWRGCFLSILLTFGRRPQVIEGVALLPGVQVPPAIY